MILTHEKQTKTNKRLQAPIQTMLTIEFIVSHPMSCGKKFFSKNFNILRVDSLLLIFMHVDVQFRNPKNLVSRLGHQRNWVLPPQCMGRNIVAQFVPLLCIAHGTCEDIRKQCGSYIIIGVGHNKFCVWYAQSKSIEWIHLPSGRVNTWIPMQSMLSNISS